MQRTQVFGPRIQREFLLCTCVLKMYEIWLTIPFEQQPPRCLELGKGDDLPGGGPAFISNLRKYDLNFQDVSRNAVCND